MIDISADLISSQTLDLSRDRLTRAAQAPTWPDYLHQLAKLGLEQWLEDRNLAGQTHPKTLQINGFKLQPLPTTALDTQTIPLPANAAIAHYYVAVTVLEDQQQVEIQGILRHDQLRDIQLGTEQELPLQWFDRDPGHLLLALRCGQPATLPNWVTNVRDWFNQQADRRAADLAWVLLPNPEPVPALRGDNLSGLNPILQSLQTQGITLPPSPQAAYQDISVEGYALRLYGVTGALQNGPEGPEWSLLLILGQQNNGLLPDGISLNLRESGSLLIEQTSQNQAYLYAQVAGSPTEQFAVQVRLPNGVIYPLPTFAYLD